MDRWMDAEEEGYSSDFKGKRLFRWDSFVITCRLDTDILFL